MYSGIDTQFSLFVCFLSKMQLDLNWGAYVDLLTPSVINNAEEQIMYFYYTKNKGKKTSCSIEIKMDFCVFFMKMWYFDPRVCTSYSFFFKRYIQLTNEKCYLQWKRKAKMIH